PKGLWRDDATVVLLDVKLASEDKYTDKYSTKVNKILGYLKEKGLPAYLVIVKGQGVYLHVGIDPAVEPKLQLKGGEGTRHVVEPSQLNDAIKGDGSAVPLVKVADWDSADALLHTKPAHVAKFRERVRASLENIDMKKLHKHVEKQSEQAVKGNV